MWLPGRAFVRKAGMLCTQDHHPGKQMHSYWSHGLVEIVSFPIKDGDFLEFFLCLPESPTGASRHWRQRCILSGLPRRRSSHLKIWVLSQVIQMVQYQWKSSTLREMSIYNHLWSFIIIYNHWYKYILLYIVHAFCTPIGQDIAASPHRRIAFWARPQAVESTTFLARESGQHLGVFSTGELHVSENSRFTVLFIDKFHKFIEVLLVQTSQISFEHCAKDSPNMQTNAGLS